MMLADFVEGHKQELIQQVESRAAASEEPGPASGRQARISALLEELVGALRQGDGSRTPPATPCSPDASLQCHERDLVRRDVIEEITRRSLSVTLAEMVIVCDWAGAADRSRLREGYRRLSELLDDVYEGAIIFTPDGRVDYINRPAANEVRNATRVPPDQILGKTGVELGVPPDFGVIRQPDELVTIARRKATQEVFFRGRWNEVRFRAIYAPSGDVSGVEVVSRDIHDPKLTHIRLKLLSKLSAMVGFVEYSDVAEALAAVPIPELADWCVVNLVEDARIVRTFVANRDPAKAPLREAAMRMMPDWTRNPLWMEMRLTTGFQLLSDVSDELLAKLAVTDEQYRVMLAAGIRSIFVQPVVSRGDIAAIFTLIYTTESGRRYGRDDPVLAEELALHAAHIIENARLLKDLRAGEARFRASVASARTIVYEQDAALRYVWYYNPIAALPPEAAALGESGGGDEAEVLADIKRRVLQSGEKVSRELPLTLGGERGFYRETIEPIRQPTGKIVGVIGSATDITEEKRTQQQLRETIAFRDRMMGILGHDLRTPLGAVTMAAGAMLRRGRLGDDDRDRAKVIQRAAERMTEMIATLLDFARVECLGKLPVSPVPTDLSVAVREVVDEARAAQQDRAIEVDARGDLHGRWDPARVMQATANLIANALQYGDARKPVRISVDGTGEAVVLRVKNEGPAVPTDLLPVLFEPFSRGPSDRSPLGLGLGLYIVRQVAIAHDGTVDVESKAETGTVFTLRLPRGQ
jgi:signal transduction histidine kinase